MDKYNKIIESSIKIKNPLSSYRVVFDPIESSTNFSNMTFLSTGCGIGRSSTDIIHILTPFMCM